MEAGSGSSSVDLKDVTSMTTATKRERVESPPARTSSPVQGPEDVVKQRTAGQAADHVTMGAFPVLLQVRLVLQHLHKLLVSAVLLRGRRPGPLPGGAPTLASSSLNRKHQGEWRDLIDSS